MRQIYKYDVTKPVVGRIEKFLHLDYQNGNVMVWAIVDDEIPEKYFSIVASGTGWHIANFQTINTYLGTLQDERGYVWHYFAVPTEIIDSAGQPFDPIKVILAEQEKENIDNDFKIDVEQAKFFHETYENFLCNSRI